MILRPGEDPKATDKLLMVRVGQVPALAVVATMGEAGAGSLLVLSQVILSLQLPFALIPLLIFTTRKKYLGPLAFGRGMSCLLWLGASAVTAMNVWMLVRLMG